MGRHKTGTAKQFVTGLRKASYNCLSGRIASGHTICDMRYAEAYKAVAYMLDDEGRSVGAGRYTAAFKKEKAKLDALRKCPIEGAILSRLMDHAKKHRTRRGIAVYVLPDGFKGSGNDRFVARFGFSLGEMKAHLEKCLVGEMSWKELLVGNIQIDHIVPTRTFDLTTEAGFKAAYAIANTQLLWRSDNARKGKTEDAALIALLGERKKERKAVTNVG